MRGKLPDAVWVKLLHKPPAVKTPRSYWRYDTRFYLPKKRLALYVERPVMRGDEPLF